MKRIAFPMFVGLLFLMGTCIEAAGPRGPEEQLLDLLNQERSRRGLGQLQWDEQVAEAARAHARLLAKNRRLSHQLSEEPGLAERIGSEGARFTNSGENLALVDDVREAHYALMNSPGHRANMLSPDYNAIGISAIENKGRWYVVEDFVHAVPVFSENEFLDAVVAAFNRTRNSKGKRLVEVQADPLLHQAACSTHGNSREASTRLPRPYELMVFTLSEPQELANRLASQASDAAIRRLNIGVCFRPDPVHGFANFWVAAAFGR
jgi:uncharacterized protein YkwD